MGHLKDRPTFMTLSFPHNYYYENPIIEVSSPIKRNFRNLSGHNDEFLKNLRHSKAPINPEWYNIISPNRFLDKLCLVTLQQKPPINNFSDVHIWLFFFQLKLYIIILKIILHLLLSSFNSLCLKVHF